MTEAALDGAAEASAKLVFADNLYVYGPPDGPKTEETPQRAEGRKGRTRIEMADAVLRAHADGKLRSTIGRSSDDFGPRGTGSTAGDNIMKPALRGKRTGWLGSLDQPHLLNYLEDTGLALVTLGERDEADGQVWHVPAAEPLTGRHGGLVSAPLPRLGVFAGRARSLYDSDESPRLLSAEEQACAHTTYVCELPSQTIKGQQPY